jgi:hypothetical protein
MSPVKIRKIYITAILRSTCMCIVIFHPFFHNQWRVICRHELAPDIQFHWTDSDKKSARCITDLGLGGIIKNFARVTSIDLSRCSHVTDYGLSQIAKYCSRLMSLNLDGCYRVKNTGFLKVFEKCSALQSLDLSCCNIKDSAFAKISKCSHLSTIRLEGCVNLTNAALFYIAECPTLTSLNLDGCSQMTDDGMLRLSQGCTSLVDLNLFHLTEVTNTGIMAIARYCTGMLSLHLFENSHIDEIGLRAVANMCTQLQRLCQTFESPAARGGGHMEHLPRCALHVAKPIAWFPSLLVLCLSMQWSSTDPTSEGVGVESMICGCPLLQEWTLSHSNITDTDLLRIVKRCYPTPLLCP